MVWLPDGEKTLKISLFVLTQYTNVTDTHTDRHTHTQTPHDGIGRAYASHRAAKTIDRNIPSSLVELCPFCRRYLNIIQCVGLYNRR